MDQLLADVLDAHGGLARWRQSRKLTVELSVGGFFWAARGWPEVSGPHTATITSALWQYLTEPFQFTYSGFDVHEIEPWAGRERGMATARAHLPRHDRDTLSGRLRIDPVAPVEN